MRRMKNKWKRKKKEREKKNTAKPRQNLKVRNLKGFMRTMV